LRAMTSRFPPLSPITLPAVAEVVISEVPTPVANVALTRNCESGCVLIAVIS